MGRTNRLGTTAIRFGLVVITLVATLGATSLAHATDDDPKAATDKTTASLGPFDLRLTPIAKVSRAVAIAFRPGDRNFYLALQGGTVVPVRPDGTAREPIVDVSDRVGTGREQGLLGLTFSPDGRRLYIYYASNDGADTLAEYTIATEGGGGAATVDDASARTLISVQHASPQHNGGQLAFGPDGMLYVAVGDGGGKRGAGPGQQTGGNSQSLDNPLGKILRIDPTPSGDRPYAIPSDNPFAGGAAPEIWQYGLRNPWRFSFDRATGDLWIGDVGQDHWEEIDTLAAGRSGANFGYPLVEGTHPLAVDEAPGTVPPVFELWHRSGNCAVIGGFVYRGKRIPQLRGTYLLADYCKGRVLAVRASDGRFTGWGRTDLRTPLITSFGQGPDGELFVLSHTKGVFRIDPGRSS